MEATIICWGYIGIMENKMETTRSVFRVVSYFVQGMDARGS